MAQLVGMSLSFCVRDMALGRVPIEDVAFITAGTCARTEDDWQEVIATYCAVYWKGIEGAALEILHVLRQQARILQPRLEGAAPLFGQHSRTAALARAERDGTLPDYWLPLEEARLLA